MDSAACCDADGNLYQFRLASPPFHCFSKSSIIATSATRMTSGSSLDKRGLTHAIDIFHDGLVGSWFHQADLRVRLQSSYHALAGNNAGFLIVVCLEVRDFRICNRHLRVTSDQSPIHKMNALPMGMRIMSVVRIYGETTNGGRSTPHKL